MQKQYTELLTGILREIANTEHIRLNDIPNIDLYMDQVTSFMDEHLKSTRRHSEDKILTKTMINNYTKNKLLPPPDRKRYSPDHMLILLFIYYFKSFLPLGDIKSILNPMTEQFFHSDKEIHIQELYEELYTLSHEQIHETLSNITDSFRTASHAFPDCEPKDQEFLQLFAFICLLSFDIYIKKDVIQKMIDALPEFPKEG